MKGDCIAYQCTEDYISTVSLQKGKMVLHSHSLLTDDSETQKYVVYMYMYVYIPLVIIKLKCRIGHDKVEVAFSLFSNINQSACRIFD